jgi:hypothetical protein
MFLTHDRSRLLVRDADGTLRDSSPDGWAPDVRHRTLAARLDECGLWSHLSEEQRATAHRDVASGCYPLDFELLHETIQFGADGEALAEGGVARFLAEIQPGLSLFGLTLDVTTVVDSELIGRLARQQSLVSAAGSSWSVHADVRGPSRHGQVPTGLRAPSSACHRAGEARYSRTGVSKAARRRITAVGASRGGANEDRQG